MENKKELYSTIYLGNRHELHFDTGIKTHTYQYIVNDCYELLAYVYHLLSNIPWSSMLIHVRVFLYE